jgi:hypothetical protein
LRAWRVTNGCLGSWNGKTNTFFVNHALANASKRSDHTASGERHFFNSAEAFGLRVGECGCGCHATLPGRTQCLGLITEPKDLQIDRISFAKINLWASLLGAASCFPAGYLIDRLGLRLVSAAIVALLGVTVWRMSAFAGGAIGLFILLLLTFLTLWELYILQGDPKEEHDKGDILPRAFARISETPQAGIKWRHQIPDPFPAPIPYEDNREHAVVLEGTSNTNPASTSLESVLAEAYRVLRPGR